MKTIKFLTLILIFFAIGCSKDNDPKKYSDLTGRWKYSDSNPDLAFSGEFDLLIKGDSVIASNGFIINAGVKNTIRRTAAYKTSHTPINLTSDNSQQVFVEHQFYDIVPASDFKTFTAGITITNDTYQGGLFHILVTRVK